MSIGEEFVHMKNTFRNNLYGIDPNKPTKFNIYKQKELKKPISRKSKFKQQSKVIKEIRQNKRKNIDTLVDSLKELLLIRAAIFLGFYALRNTQAPIQESESITDFETGHYGESKDKTAVVKNKIIDETNRQGVEPEFALAVAETESHFNKNARSPVGVIGVFQLMSVTAKGLGVNPFNVDENIKGSITLLKGHLKKYGGNRRKALAHITEALQI